MIKFLIFLLLVSFFVSLSKFLKDVKTVSPLKKYYEDKINNLANIDDKEDNNND